MYVILGERKNDRRCPPGSKNCRGRIRGNGRDRIRGRGRNRGPFGGNRRNVRGGGNRRIIRLGGGGFRGGRGGFGALFKSNSLSLSELFE